MKVSEAEIIQRLKMNNIAAEYAAYNYNGMKLEHLIPGVIESTDPAEQLLIEVRENNQMIQDLKTDIALQDNLIRDASMEYVKGFFSYEKDLNELHKHMIYCEEIFRGVLYKLKEKV